LILGVKLEDTSMHWVHGKALTIMGVMKWRDLKCDVCVGDVCAPDGRPPHLHTHRSFPLRENIRMLLGLIEALPSLVEARFASAKAASSLLFSPTEVAVLRSSLGIPVRIPKSSACLYQR
jgi:hypothetical protein